MRQRLNWSFAALIASFALIAPSAARAATASGYVCTALFDPAGGFYGSYGNVAFTLKSGADCTGTFVGNFYLLTTGADAVLAGVRYSSSQITAMLDQLLRSAADGSHVSFGYAGGGSGYGASAVTFSR